MMEKATFAAGCFWGVESTFRKVEGVESTAVGYTGGHYKNPSYKDVCSGKTGHAEAVQLEYNPNEVTYEQLLDVFWEYHNSTTLNGQGVDINDQYRSAIFYHNEEQQKIAQVSKKKLENSGKYQSEIITEITYASEFYMAEEYHQQYFEKH